MFLLCNKKCEIGKKMLVHLNSKVSDEQNKVNLEFRNILRKIVQENMP